jgi:SAM-dependent methyltransferase
MCRYIVWMQWFENEVFWQTFYGFMFERRFTAAIDEVDQVLALSGIGSGAVLDLCCGPARHGLALAERGFHVTGVDRSAFLLGKARERAGSVPIEFVQSDMRDFNRPESFDLAINLFTSFGYFENREQDLAVLRNVRASLKRGGVFVMDVISKEYVASQPQKTRWEQWPDGEILIQHCGVLPGWGRLRNHWLLVSGEHVQHFEFEHNLYSGVELTALLRAAGFHEIDLFGNLKGAPYDVGATRLVVRAR